MVHSAPSASHTLAACRAALTGPDELGARQALEALSPLPHERAEAAELALRLGRPQQVLAWGNGPLVRAAAWLRLGEAGSALAELDASQGASARHAALRARAHWQRFLGADPLGRGPEAGAATETALHLARQEGDAGALMVAVTLRGEALVQVGERFAALRALAEGLKVAEIGGQAADAHLLAVLAHAQGGPKGQRTAAKALDRSSPGSPARVLALLALNCPEDAHAQAAAGDLSPLWWAFLPRT
ncbi:hypothetical protein [Deinococcus sp. Leaf326]|uniref:hypothetical protein n=1 Tax=Deinococcus sp. Leaf326 TaxID=1736338 RepID=UPI001F384B14|nr:hypothetical protein [Deinococcus sp. Leaf326]